MSEIQIKMADREAILVLKYLQNFIKEQKIKEQKLDRFGEWKLITACQSGIDALIERKNK